MMEINKDQALLNAITEAIVAKLPTPEQQYMMQTILRSHVHKYYRINDQRVSAAETFRYAYTAGRPEEAIKMFEDALEQWTQGNPVDVVVNYATDPGVSRSPRITSIIVYK